MDKKATDSLALPSTPVDSPQIEKRYWLFLACEHEYYCSLPAEQVVEEGVLVVCEQCHETQPVVEMRECD